MDVCDNLKTSILKYLNNIYTDIFKCCKYVNGLTEKGKFDDTGQNFWWNILSAVNMSLLNREG